MRFWLLRLISRLRLTRSSSDTSSLLVPVVSVAAAAAAAAFAAAMTANRLGSWLRSQNMSERSAASPANHQLPVLLLLPLPRRTAAAVAAAAAVPLLPQFETAAAGAGDRSGRPLQLQCHYLLQPLQLPLLLLLLPPPLLLVRVAAAQLSMLWVSALVGRLAASVALTMRWRGLQIHPATTAQPARWQHFANTSAQQAILSGHCAHL